MRSGLPQKECEEEEVRTGQGPRLLSQARKGRCISVRSSLARKRRSEKSTEEGSRQNVARPRHFSHRSSMNSFLSTLYDSIRQTIAVHEVVRKDSDVACAAVGHHRDCAPAVQVEIRP